MSEYIECIEDFIRIWAGDLMMALWAAAEHLGESIEEVAAIYNYYIRG